jgi:type IV secretory pathway VirJ component
MTPRSGETAKRLQSLPLVEIPALLPAGAQRDEMAVLLTGDGGWAVTDRGLSRELAKGGIPVVGWNSLRYFLTRKSPDRAARDLELILRHYLDRWHKQRVILIGYSFGADVMPFLATRLPHDLAARISLLALLGPSGRADFRFHFTELLGKDSRDSLPTLPELERLRGTPMLCVQGAQEKNSYCPQLTGGLTGGLATVLVRPGGHIIDKNYGPIATWILGDRSTP